MQPYVIGPNWLTFWPIDWLTDWLTDRLTDWLQGHLGPCFSSLQPRHRGCCMATVRPAIWCLVGQWLWGRVAKWILTTRVRVVMESGTKISDPAGSVTCRAKSVMCSYGSGTLNWPIFWPMSGSIGRYQAKLAYPAWFIATLKFDRPVNQPVSQMNEKMDNLRNGRRGNHETKAGLARAQLWMPLYRETNRV